MGRSTWTGPLRAGPILATTGTDIARDVANVGFVHMTQTVAVTQAGTATAALTGIYLPADSQITSIRLFVTAVWSGVAATFNLGTTATATELAVAADNTGAALGALTVAPGADATRTAKWVDIGTSNVGIYMLSTNTGTGTGYLVVNYVQANNVI